MNNKERPSSCDSNSNSESNRTISRHRLVQSSCNSYLQYISTRGSSCMHVERITWCEGTGKFTCRRHTSCPVQGVHDGPQYQQHTTRTYCSTPKRQPKITTPHAKAWTEFTNPILNAEIRPHVGSSASSKHSRAACILSRNPPSYT